MLWRTLKIFSLSLNIIFLIKKLKFESLFERDTQRLKIMNLSPDPQLATSTMDYDALLLKETKTNNDNIYLKSRFEELKEAHKLLINQLVEHKIIKAEEWFETGDISSSLKKYEYLKKENEKLKEEVLGLEDRVIRRNQQMKELREGTERYIRETYGLEGFRCPQRGMDGEWGSLPTPQTYNEMLVKENEELKEENRKLMDRDRRLEIKSGREENKELKKEVKRLEEEKQQSLTILQEANSDILGDIKQGLTKDKLKKKIECLDKAVRYEHTSCYEGRMMLVKTLWEKEEDWRERIDLDFPSINTEIEKLKKENAHLRFLERHNITEEEFKKLVKESEDYDLPIDKEGKIEDAMNFQAGLHGKPQADWF